MISDTFYFILIRNLKMNTVLQNFILKMTHKFEYLLYIINSIVISQQNRQKIVSILRKIMIYMYDMYYKHDA